MKKTNNKKIRVLLSILTYIILSCVLICKYYLFTDDTVQFYSYMCQADGIGVLIFENGDVTTNSAIIQSKDKLYTELQDIFRTAKLRPSPRQIVEKLFTGKVQMLGDANANFSIFITLYQDSLPRHSIYLGGNNMMYFDKKEFFLGDFSNASELQIMNDIYKLFSEVS